MLSNSPKRQGVIESALKSSLICNETVAIPSQFMEAPFRSKLLEWVPKTRMRSNHLKLQNSFLFIDDDNWISDQSVVEYHPDVSVSLPEFDSTCHKLGSSNDTLYLLGYTHLTEDHEFHDQRNHMEITDNINEMYGIPYFSDEAQNSEWRKYLLAILAGAKVDINAFDMYCLSGGAKPNIRTDSDEFKFVDPTIFLERAEKRIDLLLPDVGQLDWQDIVEIRENPASEAFRNFVNNENFLAKEPKDILIEINEALVDAMGLYLPKRKSSFLSKLFENLPVPLPVPMPNPYALWQWYNTTKKHSAHYKKYPWFWTYYNCRTGES